MCLVDVHYYIWSRDNNKVATEVCLVDVLYYIRSRDNSKVATEVCLVDVHYYIRSRDNSKVVFSRSALIDKVLYCIVYSYFNSVLLLAKSSKTSYLHRISYNFLITNKTLY